MNDLNSFDSFRNDDFEERIKELEKENKILKIKNKDELNTKLL